MSDRCRQDRLQRGIEGDVHCWRACVCVHECVCWRVRGQTWVNTFLWTKLSRPVLWGNVQKNAAWTRQRRKNLRKAVTRIVFFFKHVNERTVRIRVWLLFHSKMSEATEETITSISRRLRLPGVFVLRVLQFRSAAAADSRIVSEKHKKKSAEATHKHL